jgi:GntR family transcriptional regulator
MIERHPSLTEQVKANLKARIIKGDFADGKIPAENELATELRVSRTTVRDALSRLEHEGTIFRKQGAGTFVNTPGLQIKSRLEEIWSYEDVLLDHGYTPSVKMLSVATIAAEAKHAAALELVAGEPLVVMRKLFMENSKPVILTVNRIPERYLRLPATKDSTEPLFKFLEAHGDRHLAYYLSEIEPVVLDGAKAELLGVGAGTAAIAFQEIGFDRDNTPVVRATSYFRDDLLRFRMIRRSAGVQETNKN